MIAMEWKVYFRLLAGSILLLIPVKSDMLCIGCGTQTNLPLNQLAVPLHRRPPHRGYKGGYCAGIPNKVASLGMTAVQEETEPVSF